MGSIKIERYHFGPTEVIGKMYIDGKYFGYTLEDVLRLNKQYGDSSIPLGKYKVKVTYSNGFKRNLPLVWNDDKTLAVVAINGDKWEGIRFHGGNTHLNTLGCVLVAKNAYLNTPFPSNSKIKNWIQGSLEKELVALLGNKTWDLEIVDKNPTQTNFMNNHIFWQNLRTNIFPGVMTEIQITTIEKLINECMFNGLVDKRDLGCVLAVAWNTTKGSYDIKEIPVFVKNIKKSLDGIFTDKNESDNSPEIYNLFFGKYFNTSLKYDIMVKMAQKFALAVNSTNQ